MNNKDFIAELSQRLGYTIDDTQSMVSNVIDAMGINFQQSEPVAVQGFGTFEIKKKLERIVVNPSTQQRMLVPPKLVLSFKPSATLKEKIKSGRNSNG
jgi:DNA-binding protein HU-beta